MKTVRHNYVVLLMLGLVFAAPGIFAYLFYNHPDWLGAKTTNKGVLLHPPVVLPSTLAIKGGGHQEMVDDHLGDIAKNHAIGYSEPVGSTWELVLWSPVSCETACVELLDRLARIRLALGRHLYEVKSQLWLGPHATELSQGLMKALDHQDMDWLRLSEKERQALSILPNRFQFFIVNPSHYIVLSYPSSVKPEAIFHDIKQLLNSTQKMGQ